MNYFTENGVNRFYLVLDSGVVIEQDYGTEIEYKTTPDGFSFIFINAVIAIGLKELENGEVKEIIVEGFRRTRKGENKHYFYLLKNPQYISTEYILSNDKGPAQYKTELHFDEMPILVNNITKTFFQEGFNRKGGVRTTLSNISYAPTVYHWLDAEDFERYCNE